MCDWRFFTFSFNSFSFLSFLLSSLRHILLARLTNASSLLRSVYLITRVSKPYSTTGSRKVSMRRLFFLSVNLFGIRAVLRRSITILVLEMQALIALSSVLVTILLVFSKDISSVLVTILLVSSTDILSQSKGFYHLIQRLGNF